MKKLSPILFLCALLSCSMTASDSPQTVTGMQGWEIVGKYEYGLAGNCTLYTKISYGHRIYWSICIGNGATSIATQ